MNENADMKKQEREQIVELGSDITKSSKGNIPVSIYVDDPETKYAVEFISKKFQISVTADFIADVRDLGLRFKVSRKNAS